MAAAAASLQPTSNAAPGNVDSNTRGAFTNSASSASLHSAASTAVSCPLQITHTIKRGDSGASVIQLQLALVQLGYLTTDSVTGYFGNKTKSAVTKFQVAQGISQTGTVGQLTRAALAAVVCGTTPPPVDTTAPTVPTGVNATPTSQTQINLTWAASTDNVGVTGYKVYRNGTQITTVTTTSYSDTGLTAGTTYSYTVAAFDAAGNVSALSASVSATTQMGTVSSGWWKPGPVALEWQWEIDHPLSITSATDMGTGKTAYNGATSPATDPTVYDIDGFDNTAATVASLHALGKKVVCYVEVGADDGRSDSAALKATGEGAAMQGWPGEHYINITNPTVASIIKARIKMCADKGFDAIEPDIDESYTVNTGFPLTKTIEESYMTMLADYAHGLGVAMWGKNPDDTGDSYASDMANTFDAVLTEECNEYSTCGLLSAYTGKKPIFNAEYAAATSAFCPADNVLSGWSGNKFPLALSGARTPCR